jgi:lipid-A-disaccharide synthase
VEPHFIMGLPTILQVRLTIVSKVLISAGEASGDLYAASLVNALRRHGHDLEFFGCAGPRMREAGVRPVVDSESIAVVGLVEVLAHIPRIHGEFQKLVKAATEERPAAAILTDSPDFHLRLAKKLHLLGIPVLQLVAPQVWAWRKRRLRPMRKVIDRLLCIFPFEEEFFNRHGISTTYIGHPLTRLVKPSASAAELRRRFGVPPGSPLVALLPGSRKGEIHRHMPYLLDAVQRIQSAAPNPPPRFILALPKGVNLTERFSSPSIQVREGEAWDVLACADLALAASGTVTIEAGLLGTPMIAFYRVNRLSWLMGKFLVRVPFYSMVNLVAGCKIVPELIQSDLTGERLAAEALRLLSNHDATLNMRRDLAVVARKLSGPEDPMDAAASVVEQFLTKERVHVS